MPYFIFLLLCFIWGSNFLLMKKAVLVFSPASIGMLRILGGAAVITVFWLYQRYRNHDSARWTLTRKEIAPMLLVAVLGYVWPFAVQPKLVSEFDSSFIAMMVAFVPLVTIVVSIPLLKVYPSPRQLIGVVGGLVLLGVIFFDAMDRSMSISQFAMAVSVPLGYAICNTYIKRRFVNTSALLVTITGLWFASLGSISVAAVESGPAMTPSEDMMMAVVAVLVLGVVGTGIASLLFTVLLQQQGPLFAGMATYLVPTIALVWGWVDGEHPSMMHMAALAGVLAMVAFVQFGAAKRSVVDVEIETA